MAWFSGDVLLDNFRSAKIRPLRAEVPVKAGLLPYKFARSESYKQDEILYTSAPTGGSSPGVLAKAVSPEPRIPRRIKFGVLKSLNPSLRRQVSRTHLLNEPWVFSDCALAPEEDALCAYAIL